MLTTTIDLAEDHRRQLLGEGRLHYLAPERRGLGSPPAGGLILTETTGPLYCAPTAFSKSVGSSCRGSYFSLSAAYASPP